MGQTGVVGRFVRRSARGARRVARAVERHGEAPLGVLAYHRVADPSCDPWNLAVAPDHFDEQLARLREVAEVVNLEDEFAGRRILGSRRRRPRYAVTFDDGYVDNLTVAIGLLERHDVPATFFIPTAFIGGSAFWWDRLDRLVVSSGVPVEAIAEAFVSCGLPVSGFPYAGAPPDRGSFHGQLHEDITWWPPEQIDDVIDRVVERLGIAEPRPDGRPMTEAELVAASGHPLITIGAHTANHRMLTKLDSGAALADLETGSKELDRMLGAKRRVLAYPHGRADRRVAALAKSAGFTHAFTTAGRTVSRTDRPCRLPRINPHDLDGAAFANWLGAPT